MAEALKSALPLSTDSHFSNKRAGKDACNTKAVLEEADLKESWAPKLTSGELRAAMAEFQAERQ